jgi:hypothetical protein
MRPFQISAFLFMPQGERPSLKFHLRSESSVVVGAAACLMLTAELAGGAKADADETSTTKRRNRTRLNMVLGEM